MVYKVAATGRPCDLAVVKFNIESSLKLLNKLVCNIFLLVTPAKGIAIGYGIISWTQPSSDIIVWRYLSTHFFSLYHLLYLFEVYFLCCL